MTGSEILEDLTGALEAVLFAGGDPLTAEQIASALDIEESAVEGLMASLCESLSSRGSGLMVKEAGGGFRLVTRPDLFTYVERLAKETSRKLSKAALETLAIVVYKQPVTKLEIEQIRGGVRAEHVLSQLVARDLVTEVGRKAVLGRPIQYGTTDTFLRLVGAKDLGDLPSLPELSDAEQLAAAVEGESLSEINAAKPEDAPGEAWKNAQDDAAHSDPQG